MYIKLNNCNEFLGTSILKFIVLNLLGFLEECYKYFDKIMFTVILHIGLHFLIICVEIHLFTYFFLKIAFQGEVYVYNQNY